jgi:hypothetical protein
MNRSGMREYSDKQWERAGKCSYISMVLCDLFGKHTSRCCKSATVSVDGKLYCPTHAKGKAGGPPVSTEAIPDPAPDRDGETWHDRPGML